MTSIDISSRLAVKATCANPMCNISGFLGPTSGLQNHYGLIWLAILDLWEGGVYFTTFVDISYRLAVKATFTNGKCNISDFGGLNPTLQDFYGLI